MGNGRPSGTLGPRHSPAERAEVAKRRSEAIKLRRAGLTYEEIADRLGYRGGRAQVYVEIERALRAALAEQHETVELYVQEELERLDRMQVGLWPAAIAGDVTAVAAVLNIMKHRARLRPGMLAPIRVQHEEITADDVDREIRRLTDELGRRAQSEAAGPAGAAGGSARSPG